jgi:asparagine synthase (glutamine-hydrolysing)
MGARHGVGFADAWSDRRLVELVHAIPQRALNTVGSEKRLVKQAVSPLLPPAVRSAQGKTDPYPLFDRALRARAAPTIENLLADSHAAARGWLDETRLREHYRQVREGRPEHNSLWWAICVEAWLRAHHGRA